MRSVDGYEDLYDQGDDLAVVFGSARETIDDLTAEYRANEATAERERREEHATALEDAAADWDDDEDRRAVMAVSAALLDGKAGKVLAALKAAGLA
jgi:hypothetical protein